MPEIANEIKFGSLSECKLCSTPIVVEHPYHVMGVCAECAINAANAYWCAHYGGPHRDFAVGKHRASRETRLMTWTQSKRFREVR